MVSQIGWTLFHQFHHSKERNTLSKLYAMPYWKKRLLRCRAGKTSNINQLSVWPYVSMRLLVRIYRVFWTVVSLLPPNYPILCKHTSERDLCLLMNMPWCSCFTYGKTQNIWTHMVCRCMFSGDTNYRGHWVLIVWTRVLFSEVIYLDTVFISLLSKSLRLFLLRKQSKQLLVSGFACKGGCICFTIRFTVFEYTLYS